MNTLQLAQEIFNRLFYANKIVEYYEMLRFAEECETDNRFMLKQRLENYIKKYKEQIADIK